MFSDQDVDALRRCALIAERYGNQRLATECNLAIAEARPACEVRILMRDGTMASAVSVMDLIDSLQELLHWTTRPSLSRFTRLSEANDYAKAILSMATAQGNTSGAGADQEEGGRAK